MSPRSKFIKVRVAPEEYAGIARRADEAGATMSEYVRDTVTAVHEQLALREELTALRGLVTAQPASAANDALALETVLLLRELAAARDAQILARVRAQLAQTQKVAA